MSRIFNFRFTWLPEVSFVTGTIPPEHQSMLATCLTQLRFLLRRSRQGLGAHGPLFQENFPTKCFCSRWSQSIIILLQQAIERIIWCRLLILSIVAAAIGDADDYDKTKEIYKFDPRTESWSTLENQLLQSGYYDSLDAVLFKDVKDQCICN